MNVDDDEIIQRRYILTVARNKIAALNYDDDGGGDEWDGAALNYDNGRDTALAIIDALIKELNA